MWLSDILGSTTDNITAKTVFVILKCETGQKPTTWKPESVYVHGLVVHVASLFFLSFF